jgi:lipoyl(octanoyl) transferase
MAGPLTPSTPLPENPGLQPGASALFEGLECKFLGRVDYAAIFSAMQRFTEQRGLQDTTDAHNQLWICEHFPVFTQGLAGKAEHVLNPGNIPIVQSNRGGQVTYHGPGQVVAYPLLDLRRAGYFVKEYVHRLEEAVIRTLQHFGVTGHRVRGAPGIYVRLDDPFGHAKLMASEIIGGRTQLPHDENGGLTPIKLPSHLIPHNVGKIAALGIKVSRHFSYHGVALNVAMDLEPFSRINPCGYAGLQTVDFATIGVSVSPDEVAAVFAQKLAAHLAP